MPPRWATSTVWVVKADMLDDEEVRVLGRKNVLIRQTKRWNKETETKTNQKQI